MYAEWLIGSTAFLTLLNHHIPHRDTLKGLGVYCVYVMEANTRTEYNIRELNAAYAEGISNEPGQYAIWSRVEEAYDGDARGDFATAIQNGDIQIADSKAGIRGEGNWPVVGKARVWLEF